mgnify:CR=1 FL=1
MARCHTLLILLHNNLLACCDVHAFGEAYEAVALHATCEYTCSADAIHLNVLCFGCYEEYTALLRVDIKRRLVALHVANSREDVALVVLLVQTHIVEQSLVLEVHVRILSPRVVANALVQDDVERLKDLDRKSVV